MTNEEPDEMVVSLDRMEIIRMACSHLAQVYGTERHPKSSRLHDITNQLGILVQRILSPKEASPQSWENQAARCIAVIMALMMDGDDSIPWTLPESREEWRDHFTQLEGAKLAVEESQQRLEATLSGEKVANVTQMRPPEETP
jgi:hypothetical protein